MILYILQGKTKDVIFITEQLLLQNELLTCL